MSTVVQYYCRWPNATPHHLPLCRGKAQFPQLSLVQVPAWAVEAAGQGNQTGSWQKDSTYADNARAARAPASYAQRSEDCRHTEHSPRIRGRSDRRERSSRERQSCAQGHRSREPRSRKRSCEPGRNSPSRRRRRSNPTSNAGGHRASSADRIRQRPLSPAEEAVALEASISKLTAKATVPAALKSASGSSCPCRLTQLFASNSAVMLDSKIDHSSCPPPNCNLHGVVNLYCCARLCTVA